MQTQKWCLWEWWQGRLCWQTSSPSRLSCRSGEQLQIVLHSACAIPAAHGSRGGAARNSVPPDSAAIAPRHGTFLLLVSRVETLVALDAAARCCRLVQCGQVGLTQRITFGGLKVPALLLKFFCYDGRNAKRAAADNDVERHDSPNTTYCFDFDAFDLVV
jgi:hypothetical protein